MKKQSKNSNKMKASKVVIFTLVIGVACALVVAIVLFATKQPSRAQIDALDKASEDLHQLYTKLMDTPGVDVTSASFKKSCHQASAKFSEGAITCGPEGRISIDNNQSVESQKNNAESILNNLDVFTYNTAEGIRDDRTNNVTGFVLHFTHRETGVPCSLISESQKYIISCFETVPDFIPGYIVDE